jgi:hypothetical protein
MPYTSDHDGKSKTASDVNHNHYPEQNEVDNLSWETDDLPTHEQIAERAHQLWIERGRPDGSPEQDWLQAEEELRAALNSRDAIEATKGRGGSVQR